MNGAQGRNRTSDGRIESSCTAFTSAAIYRYEHNCRDALNPPLDVVDRMEAMLLERSRRDATA
jgi:hypothetical protein